MAEVKVSKEYKTISEIAGPLVFVEKTEPVAYKELVSVKLSDGSIKRGEVLDTSDKIVIVQIFEGTSGIDRAATVRFLGETMKMPVSKDMLGRILSGAGDPLDGGPAITPEKKLDIVGAAINPWARDSPSDFIQTGISTIDGMNTLVRGQKLPIFSGSGLPHNDLALQIARQAKVRGENEEFAVVFIAMGITNEEKQMFMSEFERTGALKNAVVFLNLADDPAVERIVTPRLGLTTAEYMAFELGMQVLVIMTDITNYCEALRQVGAAREEVPGRRGYPGYMYTDLAQLYERAGRIKGKKGSVTQIPILSMPGDDITHPIPDLSGYITEGQIVMSRELHRAGIYPPVNVSSSLSRLMGGGTGAGKTREDHKGVSDQLYAAYAEGKDLRGLVAIVGKESLSEKDRKLLDFADMFEDKFVRQGHDDDRSIEDTLTIAWDLIKTLDMDQITRIDRKYIEKYMKA
jgi:V/A-type H+-transporting ATPase subunit B